MEKYFEKIRLALDAFKASNIQAVIVFKPNTDETIDGSSADWPDIIATNCTDPKMVSALLGNVSPEDEE